MRTAVFTIASRNYFAFVRTLMQSLEKSNPEYERYVGVADEITEEFSRLPRNFELLSLEELDLPHKDKMLFRYNILELNTAIKPFVFHTIFEKLGYDRVIYFDPDIYVYEKLTELEMCFERGYEIVLTPHLNDVCDDEGIPNDLDIIKSGIYNLGFLALSKSLNTMKLIRWWEGKLEYQCIESFKDGLFVDQKWMDLVPAMFQHVCIFKHSGYNVAYWNMAVRKWRVDSKGKYVFNDDPLVFFHFSGLNPQDISGVSKYQNRFDINRIGVLKKLFEEYAATVLDNGFTEFKKFNYAYNHFDNGSYISDLLRKEYREHVWLQKKCGSNPFKAEKVFYENRSRIFPYMLEKVWYEREDIRMTFPQVKSAEYINWFLSVAMEQYKIPLFMLENLNISKILKEECVLRSKIKGKNKTITFIKGHTSEKTKKLCKRIYRKMNKS